MTSLSGVSLIDAYYPTTAEPIITAGYRRVDTTAKPTDVDGKLTDALIGEGYEKDRIGSWSFDIEITAASPIHHTFTKPSDSGILLSTLFYKATYDVDIVVAFESEELRKALTTPPSTANKWGVIYAIPGQMHVVPWLCLRGADGITVINLDSVEPCSDFGFHEMKVVIGSRQTQYDGHSCRIGALILLKDILRFTQDQSAEDVLKQFRIESLEDGRRYYPQLPAVFAKTVQVDKKAYDPEALIPGKRGERLGAFFERSSEEVSFVHKTKTWNGNPIQVKHARRVCTYLLHKGARLKGSAARLFNTATVLSTDTNCCVIIGKYVGNGKLELRGEGAGLHRDSGPAVTIDHKGRFALIGLHSGTKYKLYECKGERVCAEEEEHSIAEGEMFQFVKPIFTANRDALAVSPSYTPDISSGQLLLEELRAGGSEIKK